jgi:hypothetical protein
MKRLILSLLLALGTITSLTLPTMAHIAGPWPERGAPTFLAGGGAGGINP